MYHYQRRLIDFPSKVQPSLEPTVEQQYEQKPQSQHTSQEEKMGAGVWILQEA